jgi:hypothetical protein
MTDDLLGPGGGFPFPEPDPFPFPKPPIPDPPDWQRFPWKPPQLDKIRWPIKYGPAKVKILVVIDSSGGYDTGNDFSLGIMLRDAFNVGVPAATPLPDDYPAYARFEFTLAHRSTGLGATPGFDNFQFSAATLAGFHEVWLFGISASAPYVNGAELTALETFMSSGGGVLAMGDHEDLGLGLCGNIPRVRTMRKWWYNAPFPPSQAQAPDSTNLTRNDTVQLIGGVDPGSFPGQEDGVPQPVYINYRLGHHWWRPHRWFRYPHPMLCGPRGAITVFPDHPHEGDVVLPAALDPAEYPGGVAPEVIARGRNVVGRTKSGITITVPREFGLLGAYDGHQPAANVGRIAVDSTWHHWFNVNLIGLDDPPHSVSYKDILAFFRNVAVWLAPKERQQRMRLTGQFIVLFTTSMIERTLTIRDFVPERFYVIGIEARDALGRLAPQCQVNIWLLDLIAPLVPHIRKRLEALRPEEEEPDIWEAYVLDRLAMNALGGAMTAMALEARKHDYREGDAVIAKADEIAMKGLRMGVEQAQRELQSHALRLGSAISALAKPAGKLASERAAETAD